MMNVYCISGMGMDGRLFKNLKLDNCIIHHIRWETPLENESLSAYAMRLSQQIEITKPFVLIGVSFGGMCCIEIAKKFKPVKTFLISSCKTIGEVPAVIKMWAHFPLYKTLSDTAYKNAAMMLQKQFGVASPEHKEKFKQMLDDAPENYFKGAVQCIMTWKNTEVPEKTIHIHGTADQVLPFRSSMNCNYIIKDGTHFMIITKADEINKIINEELNLQS